MTLDNISSILVLLGVGGVFGTYFRILWERRNTVLLQKQDFKEKRYKCIINLMYSALDFEKNNPKLREHGRNFASLNDLLDELKVEWNNMILYASDDVLSAVHDFISDPDEISFKWSVLLMRKDLWGGKLSLKLETLTFDKK